MFLVFFSALFLAAGQPHTELDIRYAREPIQTLDLYLPAGTGFITVVYTYGGGWHSGSGKSSRPIAEELVRLGYACALVSHRLFPPDPFPAPVEDLAAAFAWVKSNIASRGGNPKKVLLAGHSSGAHLSLLLATNPKYLLAYHMTPGDIRAVIGLSTPVDLSRHPDGLGYGDVLLSGHGGDPFRRDEALMRDASPISHVSQGLPATLLVTGESDFPMLAADAHTFARKASGFGDRVRVVVVPGRDHMGVARGMIDDRDVVLTTVQEFIQAETTARVK
jgi:acetyl esterase/lipase